MDGVTTEAEIVARVKSKITPLFGKLSREASLPASEPKDQTQSEAEKEVMKRRYNELLKRWRNYRRYDWMPDELDDEFSLVDQGRPKISDDSAPHAFFDFASQYGYFALTFWTVNRNSKVIINTADLYTQGQDGNTKGKGHDGLKALQETMQAIADHTGYTIIDLATTNIASESMLADDPEYREFTAADRKELQKTLEPSDKDRFNRLMIDSVLPHPTRIKSFQPAEGYNDLSPKQLGEMEAISKVTYL